MSRSKLILPHLQRNFSRCAKRFDAAYDGPGKSTVTIMNEDKGKLLIDGFSKYGFILNNKMRVLGPMIVMPDAVLQWRIESTLSVNPKAFSFFKVLHPRPDIVFFGYGAKHTELGTKEGTDYDRNYIRERNKMVANVILAMRNSKINVEALPTEDAIGAYNYLVGEDRLVCAALIPPELVPFAMSNNQDINSNLLTHEFGKLPESIDTLGSPIAVFEGELQWRNSQPKQLEDSKDENKTKK